MVSLLREVPGSLLVASLVLHGFYREEVKVRSEAVLSPFETHEVSGHKRDQSGHLKFLFHLKVANGILDVMASRNKVLNRSPTIAYQTFQ